MPNYTRSGRPPTTTRAIEDFLLTTNGRSFTAAQLARAVYGSDSQADIRAVQSALSRIRRKSNRVIVKSFMAYHFEKARTRHGTS